MRRKFTNAIIEQIREDREGHGFTITQVMVKYGMSRGTAYNTIKEMDASNVKRASPKRKVVPHIGHTPRPELSKVNLGEATRQMIAARLMLNGVSVYRPLSEDTPVDLLILSEGLALKCQCKYIFPTKNGSHQMNLHTGRSNSKHTHKHRYTAEEVDFFLGYCLDNDSVYVIPYKDCGGRSNLLFWILREPANVGQTYDTKTWQNAYHYLTSR